MPPLLRLLRGPLPPQVGEKLAAMRRFRLDLQTPSKVQLVEDLFRCLCKEAGVPDADGEGGPAAAQPCLTPPPCSVGRGQPASPVWERPPDGLCWTGCGANHC